MNASTYGVLHKHRRICSLFRVTIDYHSLSISCIFSWKFESLVNHEGWQTLENTSSTDSTKVWLQYFCYYISPIEVQVVSISRTVGPRNHLFGYKICRFQQVARINSSRSHPNNWSCTFIHSPGTGPGSRKRLEGRRRVRSDRARSADLMANHQLHPLLLLPCSSPFSLPAGGWVVHINAVRGRQPAAALLPVAPATATTGVVVSARASSRVPAAS